METLAVRSWRALRLRIPAANFVGAVAVFVFLQIALHGPDHDGLANYIFLFAALLSGLAAAGDLAGRRVARPALLWLYEGRPPTTDERQATLAQPFRQARVCFVGWLVAAVAWALVELIVFGSDIHQALRIADGIVFGGLTTTALVYLLTERTLRPVFAIALHGEPPPSSHVFGIRPRLLLAWALGSGVPLFALAGAPMVIKAPNWELPVAVLGGVGLLAGAIITFVAAHSVADPLEAVREGLARVERGELDVTVSVDDGGEVGLLQAGFNRMVQGLRERRRLADLFGRQVGEQVAQLAIEHDVDLGGEQVEASVLFVDLIGSTALAQDRPPAEVVELLNRFFATVVPVVNDEGGYVSRFEGDGALCLFGAPAPLAEHASRALRAGRRLGGALADAGLDAGVGISSGIVVAGNVGTQERYEYTVIGDPVNEASRLTDEAKRHTGRVLASEMSIAWADEEALNWARGEERTLRGRQSPTVVYEPHVVALRHEDERV